MRLAARTILATLAATALAVAPVSAATAASTPTTPTDVRVLDVGPDFAVIAFTGSANDSKIKWYTLSTYDRTMVTTTPSSTVFGGLRAGRSYTLTVTVAGTPCGVVAPETSQPTTVNEWVPGARPFIVTRSMLVTASGWPPS